MLSFDRIKRDYGGYVCRECTSEYFHVHLHRSDCKYGKARTCRGCRNPRRQVVGLTLRGRLRTMFK